MKKLSEQLEIQAEATKQEISLRKQQERLLNLEQLAKGEEKKAKDEET